MANTIKLQITFASLIEAIAALSLSEKQEILQILESQVAEAEEDLMEQESGVLSEISEARKAYHDGDYQTIQEYVTSRSTKSV
jgi:hypothetical protein